MYAKAGHASHALHDVSQSVGDAARRINYRSAITRHNPPESDHTYYDGGDLSPYCLDSLVELLHAEARQPHTTLDLDMEIAGPCPAERVREVCARLSDLSIQGLRVHVRAEGHGALDIAT